MNLARNPWLASGLVHGVLLGALGLSILGLADGPRPAALRMHLVGTSGSVTPGASRSTGWWKAPAEPSVPPAEVGAPGWSNPTPGSTVPSRPTVPANLDELLGPTSAPSASPTSAETFTGGWTSPGGQGYQAPPLPPPQLVPLAGARWTLVMTVSAAGGPAQAVKGLDSGHPDLDRWLEAYLRTVSFPPAPDGIDYQVRWSLTLDTSRPE